MRGTTVAIAVLPDLLPVRCKLCQAILPGWFRLGDSPHSSLLMHHLSHRHPEAFRPYLHRMDHECIATVLMELFERVEGDVKPGTSDAAAEVAEGGARRRHS